VGQPNGASRLCLSCHDGTVALGSYRRGTTVHMFGTGAGGLMPPGLSNLGTDLRGTHPVSMPMPATKAEYKEPMGHGVTLDNQKRMQCTSCHDPHKDDADPLLRKFLVGSNAYSAICMQCHTPIGYLTGTTPPFFELESLPARVREGITCTTCHAMTLRSPAVDEAGAVYHLDPRGPMLGSIPDPDPTSAHASESLPFFARSSACLPCHDLFIGGNRAEVTYSEWGASSYAAMGVECQTCHMPASEGPAAVGGRMRQVHDHRMIGVDVALVDFPDREANRARVADLLARSVRAELELPGSVVPGDSLAFAVEVFNTGAGHSIPSGASFLREMWLRVTVRTAAGDTLLVSGLLDESDNIVQDPALHVFQSTIQTSGPSLTMLTSIDNSPLIPALGSRKAAYGVRVPAGASGPLAIEAKVLFRSFAPATLRAFAVGQYVGLIAEPAVMDEVEGAVAVGP
jgi:predicted CXXCH cytochrome family protein